MTAGEYKRFKGLKKQNLRDNMTDMELILSILAEESTEKYLNNFRTLPKKYQKIVSDTIFKRTIVVAAHALQIPFSLEFRLP